MSYYEIDKQELLLKVIGFGYECRICLKHKQ